MFVTEGLAFNPSFFGFINPNWAIAILGFFVTLFGFYLEKSDRELRSLGRDMANILPWVGGGLLILFLSILIPSILHYQLNVAYAKGDYRFVQTTSKTLMAVYPPFRGDEAFLERMAKAGYYGDSLQDASPRAEPELIEFVKGLESYRQSDWLNAETHFHNSLEQQPKNFLARAYLANAIVNRGVAHLSDANHRQAGTAADLFERALQIFPYHTEALYDLTIARTINGEFERSANNALKIIESQKYAQRPRPALLGQAYLHLTWRGFKDDNLERAWQRYRQSVDDGAWKDVIEGES
jgi:tetratricopeptide (TPR) repeat protein